MTKTEHVCNDSCKKCEGCGTCMYVAGFKQDKEAGQMGYPFFFCLKCGKNNFWD
jgi:hypothetical protein